MTDTEMILEALTGLSEKLELSNALIAGLFMVLGIIGGILFLRELWRKL